MAERRYTVTFEHGEQSGWIASVDEIPGCHTQGRGIRQTRRRIRQALALWIGEAAAERADVVEHFPVPAGARQTLGDIEKLEAEVDQLRELQQRLVQKRRKAAAVLVRTGYSYRDAGDLLGISHQRVEQLLSGKP